MTNQEKRDWLKRYNTNEREIRRLEGEIERWESRAQKMTPSYSFAPSGQDGDRLQGAVDRLVELRGGLYDRLTAAMELRRSIERAVDSVANERLRLLLRCHYINGARWEEIAVDWKTDYRWILRLHRRALEQLTIESHIESVI